VASDQNTDPVTEDALGGHHQIRLCDSNMDNDIAHAIRKYVRQHDQSCRLKDHFPDDDKQCRRLTRRKNTNLRHERHLHKIAQGRHVFCACEHHRDNRQDDRREEAYSTCKMRTEDDITTPVQSGCVRERRTAQDWLERVVICTIESVLATRRDARLVPRNSPSIISKWSFRGGCWVRALYGCRKPMKQRTVRMK